MPWRNLEGVDALIHEVTNPVLWVDVVHNRDRHVQVQYYNQEGEMVEVAVEHLDSNSVRVSAVNFILGSIVII